MSTLYKAYPHCKRSHPLTEELSYHSFLTHNVVNTEGVNNDSDDDDSDTPDPDDPFSASTTTTASNSATAAYKNLLRDHLEYVKRGGRLRDGLEGVEKGCVVAVQPPRRNSHPWFGKVVEVREGSLLLLWLHLRKSRKYFYIDNSTDVVANDSVICNGVECQPLFGEELLWKLMTPIAFIQQLNSDAPPTLDRANPLPEEKIKEKKIDLTRLVFEDEEEFAAFLLEGN